MHERDPNPGQAERASAASVLQGEVEVVTFHSPESLYSVLKVAPERGYDDPEARTLWRQSRVTAVGEIEKRIETAERQARETEPPMDRPAGVPVDYAEHIRLMFDLQVLAFQSDLTRVITFMLAREGSNQSYRSIGVPEGHHGLTHHRGNPEWVEKVTRINRHHLEQFAYFVGKLKATPDGDGSLLDHAMLVYGSGISDGNRHFHHDLPVLVAGRGCGALHPGRHLRQAAETPMTNLYLALLGAMGVRTETLGDSNGQLNQLAGL